MPANEPGNDLEHRRPSPTWINKQTPDPARRRRFAGKPAPTRPPVRAIAAVGALLLVTACGFHIRGSYDIPPSITPMHVDGAGGNSVAAELRDNLQRNDIALVSPPEASSRLVISERNERQVLSVGSTGRVDEYELIYTVEWRLEAPGRETPLMPAQRLEARRDYTANPTEVLGREDQEDALLESMRSDLVTRIMFRLQAWSPSEAPSPGR